MLKTYVWLGNEATRVRLKKGQAKVSVEPGESVVTELNLRNASRNFQQVGASSVEDLKNKLSSMDAREKAIEIELKKEFNDIDKKAKDAKKEAEDKAKEKLSNLSKERSILENQVKYAAESLETKKAELEAQAKSINDEIAKMNGDIQETRKPLAKMNKAELTELMNAYELEIVDGMTNAAMVEAIEKYEDTAE